MAVRTVLTDAIAERTTPVLGATFVDEDGDTVTDLLTATATIHDVKTGAIINGRDDFDLLDPSLVTAGVLAWRLEPEDTVILGTATVEEHVVLLEWTWDAGGGRTGHGKHEIVHRVQNFAQVA